MPYDSSLPANGTKATAAQMRGQFAGLKELIDAIVTIVAAQIAGVSTLPPGEAAAATVSVAGDTLHFTIGIPQGMPGEVSNAALDAAIAGTSANTNAVATLGIAVSDPPTQAQMQAIADKQDELILALRRA